MGVACRGGCALRDQPVLIGAADVTVRLRADAMQRRASIAGEQTVCREERHLCVVRDACRPADGVGYVLPDAAVAAALAQRLLAEKLDRIAERVARSAADQAAADAVLHRQDWDGLILCHGMSAPVCAARCALCVVSQQLFV